MKKGLLIALGTIMIALAGRANAEAPIILDIPDVIIGDGEDNVGLTIDQNLFRYENAFNFLDFQSDPDSSSSALRLAYIEWDANGVVSPSNDVSVNGKGPILLANANDPAAWGTNELSGGGTNFFMSFRNLIWSPVAGTAPFPDPTDAAGTPIGTDTTALLPWRNDATSGGALTDQAEADRYRWISVYLADGSDSLANISSNTMKVWTVNNGMDSLSGGAQFTTLFTDDLTGWTWGQEGITSVGAATSASGTSPKFIELQAGGTAGSSLGNAYWARWQQTNQGLTAPIEFVPGDVIYAARMKLNPTTATSSLKGLLPRIRFGVQNSVQGLLVMNSVVGATHSALGGSNPPDDLNPQLPALGTERVYDTYWDNYDDSPNYDDYNVTSQSLDFRRWQYFFDMVDADADGSNGGTWRMTDLVIGTMPRPRDMAPVAGSSTAFVLTDVTSTGGFAANGTPAGGTITENTDGSVTLAAAAGTGNILLWERALTAPWMSGKLLRFSPTLACPDAERANFRALRIRHYAALGNVTQEWSILRPFLLDGTVTTQPGIPDADGHTYEGYLPTYGGANAYLQGLSSSLADLVWFRLGIDYLPTAGEADASSVVFSQIQYEALNDPLPEGF